MAPSPDPSTPGKPTTLPVDYRTVLDLLPPNLSEKITAAQKRSPELFKHDEKTLRKSLQRLKSVPTPTDNMLRLNFWREFQRAKFENEDFRVTSIYNGVCSQQFFTDNYMKRAEKVAWLMCVPSEYDVSMREALSFGITKMRDILDLEVVDDKTGKINVTLAGLQFRVAQKLHEMVMGATVQRSVQVHIGENAAQDKAIQDAIQSNNMEAIQRKLKELEKRDRLKPLPIEVEAEEVASDPEPVSPAS